jgi:hypothetical protein
MLLGCKCLDSFNFNPNFEPAHPASSSAQDGPTGKPGVGTSAGPFSANTQHLGEHRKRITRAPELKNLAVDGSMEPIGHLIGLPFSLWL